MGNNVAIVIPAYKENIGRYEEIAIDRCCKVFGEKYDIYLLVPNSLEFNDLLQKFPILKRKSLDDSNFAGIAAYNRMLISSQFYRQFDNYDYLLIYQLDAFVFRDDLDRWCAAGYDYVGAPWNEPKLPFVWLSTLTSRVLRRLVCYHTDYFRYGFVGNGGVSLRRISRFIELAQKMEQNPKLSNRIKSGKLNEDVVWSMYVPDHVGNMKVPDYHQAEAFGIDMLPDTPEAADVTMFSHGWNKNLKLIEYWRQRVEKCGYKL